MKISATELDGVYLIDPIVYGDERGYFFESFHESRFSIKLGLNQQFVQDNESLSKYGVVRGLHYQKAPYSQAKLVRVVTGAVWDVVVDIRKHSPNFGRYMAVELSGENKRQVYIPQGFAHGYAVLSDEAIFQYKCSDYYHPEAEGGIAWNDPELAIPWPIPAEQIILSEKDRCHPRMADAELFE